MRKKILQQISLIGLILLILTSCSKDNDEVIDITELNGVPVLSFIQDPQYPEEGTLKVTFNATSGKDLKVSFSTGEIIDAIETNNGNYFVEKVITESEIPSETEITARVMYNSQALHEPISTMVIWGNIGGGDLETLSISNITHDINGTSIQYNNNSKIGGKIRVKVVNNGSVTVVPEFTATLAAEQGIVSIPNDNLVAGLNYYLLITNLNDNYEFSYNGNNSGSLSIQFTVPDVGINVTATNIQISNITTVSADISADIDVDPAGQIIKIKIFKIGENSPVYTFTDFNASNTSNNFSGTISDLTESTDYIGKMFLNDETEAFESFTFTTESISVVTNYVSVSNITQSSATVNANMNLFGIGEKTITIRLYGGGGTNHIQEFIYTTDTIGEYSITNQLIEGLDPFHVYELRFFLNEFNSLDDSFHFIEFTTLADPNEPIVSFGPTTNIGPNSAELTIISSAGDGATQTINYNIFRIIGNEELVIGTLAINPGDIQIQNEFNVNNINQNTNVSVEIRKQDGSFVVGTNFTTNNISYSDTQHLNGSGGTSIQTLLPGQSDFSLSQISYIANGNGDFNQATMYVKGPSGFNPWDYFLYIELSEEGEVLQNQSDWTFDSAELAQKVIIDNIDNLDITNGQNIINSILISTKAFTEPNPAITIQIKFVFKDDAGNDVDSGWKDFQIGQ